MNKKVISITSAINLLLILICMFIFGEKNTSANAIEFQRGTYFNKNWEESIGTYSKPVVANKETALALAQVVFDGMEKSKEVQSYVPKSVFYDTKDKIWIVTFAKEMEAEQSVLTIGGGCSIAIREDTGEVLRIWFAE